MTTFLFDQIIFGPVWSRRLGESLGINLLPAGRKICNFNCIYCECGITPSENQHSGFPEINEVIELLTDRLSQMKSNSEYLDSITFAGNGEPTLHPQFSMIVDEVIGIRDHLFPGTSVAVLSNATTTSNSSVFEALLKVDLNILKLDSAIEETLININCPRQPFRLDDILSNLRKFKGNLIIQTLFMKGYCNGKYLDNTTEKEVNAWLEAIESIRPESVMLYSLARDPAVNNLERVSEDELMRIAALLEERGINTQVTP